MRFQMQNSLDINDNKKHFKTHLDTSSRWNTSEVDLKIELKYENKID